MRKGLLVGGIMAAAATAGPGAAPALAIDLESATIVDLSHAYGDETIYWPTSPSRFEIETLSDGVTEGGWYYSAFAFSMPEHGGTHLDAPMHFDANGWSVDEVPIDRLVAPAIVIDVTGAAAVDADYLLTPGDVARFEAEHGDIPADSIVLLRTGWSARWPDAKSYLGDDAPGDASNLHFPGYGAEAARLLVEQRGVAVLGIDTASIDYGQSADFQVHRIAAARNVPGLENLTGLDQLPATGAWIIALPVKIEGGSGGPVRVIAAF